MSIDELKKRAKLSLDEMHDNKFVGNMETHKPGHPDAQPTRQPISQPAKLPGILTTKQPATQPIEKYSCKVTFNMTERLLDEFNAIYARRILNKQKTDKSALFCEAISLLIEKESK